MQTDISSKEPDLESPLYDLTTILGKPNLQVLLTEEGWLSIVKVIDPIFKWSSFQGSISSGQMFLTTRKFVKGLKGLPWNDKSNRKLAVQHISDGNVTETLYSLMTDIVCPSWKKCEELHINPDLIIKIEKNLRPNDERFTFSFMIAIRKELLNEERKNLLENSILQIGNLMNAMLIMRKERNYRYKNLLGDYTDALQDVLPGSDVNDDQNLVDALKEKDWKIILQK